MTHPRETTGKGFLALAISSLLWGGTVILWKRLQHVPVSEILACRIVFSVLVMLPFFLAGERLRRVRSLLASPRELGWLFLSAFLIGSNWLAYMGATTLGRMLELSLGCFSIPLLSAFVGTAVLHERLSPLRKCAFAVAGVGVGYAFFSYSEIPWFGLYVPFSFVLYGLVRRQIKVEALEGMLIENGLLFPLAGAWLLWQGHLGNEYVLSPSAGDFLLLFFSGIITLIPITLYIYAVRHVEFITVGFFQFVSPSIVMLLGVCVYGETLSVERLFVFLCIWASLAFYMLDGIREHARRDASDPSGHP